MAAPKVVIQIKADIKGKGQSEMEVRMKPAAVMRKLMTAWCSQHSVAAESASFLWQGRKLLPEETVMSLGWTSLDGPIVVDVTIVEHSSSEVGPPPQSLMVEIHAEDEEGASMLPFKMKLTTLLDKMVDAWYKHHGLEVGSASFMLNDQELSTVGQDLGTALAAVGLDPQKPPMPIKIRACPHNDAPAAPASSSSQAKSEAKKMPTPVPSTSEESAQANGETTMVQKPVAPSDEDVRVPVRVVAEGPDGEATLNFRMKPSTTFAKVMNAWSQHYNIPPEEAEFMINNDIVKPGDSPLTVGWKPSMEEIVISASPKEGMAADVVENVPSQPGNNQHASSNDKSPALPLNSQESNAVDKLSVEVHAQGSDGLKVVSLEIAASAELESLMDSWCKAHSMQMQDVMFSYSGKELQSKQTPAACGWSSQSNPIVVYASPRPVKAAVGEGQAASENPDEQVKVSLRVVAEGSDGDTEVTFRMRPTTTFAKMMEGWSKAYEVPLAEVNFLMVDSGRPLKPEDTPLCFGWTPEAKELLVRAIPRDAEESSCSQGAKPPQMSKASSAVSKATPEVLTGTAPIEGHGNHDVSAADGAKDDQPTAKVASPAGGNEKLVVEVHAESAEGKDIITIKMWPHMSLSKMMSAWCKEHHVQEDHAMFLHNGTELKPEDSPETLGWALNSHPIIVNAMPRIKEVVPSSNDLEPSVSSPPRSPLGSGDRSVPSNGVSEAASSGGAQPSTASSVGSGAPPPDSSGGGNTSAASSIDAASDPRQADDSTVDIAVVAEGENGSNTIRFKMKMTTPLSRMMTSWSNHHGISLSQATFLHNNVELLPEQTPGSHGWSGEITVFAVPKDDKTPTPKSSKKRNNAGETGQKSTGQKRGSSAYQCFSKARRPKLLEERPELRGQMSQQNSALAAEWKELGPEERQPYEEESRREKEKIDALQKEQEASVHPVASKESADASKSPEAIINPDSVIMVTVEAEGEDGPSQIQFRMKAGTALEKMMTAWCGQHEIPVSEAAFIFEGKELKANETLASLNAVDEIVVQAIPRLPDGSVPESALRKSGSGVSAVSLDASASQSPQTPKAQSAAKSAGRRLRLSNDQDDSSDVLQASKRGAKRPPGDKVSPPPKRTATSFLCYSRKRRATLLQDKPELKGRMSDQTKALAAEWKELSPEDRKPYEEESSKDKERFKDEMLAYQERHPEFRPQRKSKGKPGQKRQRRHKELSEMEDSLSSNWEESSDDEDQTVRDASQTDAGSVEISGESQTGQDKSEVMDMESEQVPTVRRSARLAARDATTPQSKRFKFTQVIVHPAPAPSRGKARTPEKVEKPEWYEEQKKAIKNTPEVPENVLSESDEAVDEDDDQKQNPSRMSYKEYKMYDRQQRAAAARAKREREKIKQWTDPDMDEETALAIALSLSMQEPSPSNSAAEDRTQERTTEEMDASSEQKDSDVAPATSSLNEKTAIAVVAEGGSAAA